MTPRTTLVPRTGLGFDVHRLVHGRPLVLCGVRIAHDRGLDGHSDADVGLHALCDAIYGALAEGDIGRWFPPSRAQWKDADSATFLAHAAGRVAARGGILVHVDVTLVCESPRIAPHARAGDRLPHRAVVKRARAKERDERGAIDRADEARSTRGREVGEHRGGVASREARPRE